MAVTKKILQNAATGSGGYIYPGTTAAATTASAVPDYNAVLQAVTRQSAAANVAQATQDAAAKARQAQAMAIQSQMQQQGIAGVAQTAQQNTAASEALRAQALARQAEMQKAGIAGAASNAPVASTPAATPDYNAVLQAVTGNAGSPATRAETPVATTNQASPAQTTASVQPVAVSQSAPAQQNPVQLAATPAAAQGSLYPSEFDAGGYSWHGGKLVSIETGDEAPRSVYDEVYRISNVEDMDIGVAADMLNSNLRSGRIIYGTGADRADREARAQAAADRGTSGQFARQPGETNEQMALRILDERQAQTGGDIVDYGAGPVLVGGNYSGGGNPGSSSTSESVYSQILNSPEYQPESSGYETPERDQYYEPNYQRLLQQLEAYPDFQWDQNSDPVWAALAKQYRREGQRATADALGQAAANTGGIASSAAVTAAAQAGNYYAGQLSDRLPEVYQQAYQRYLDEYSRLMGLTNQYRSGMDFEEDQFRNDRNFGYGQYSDDRNFDYQKYLNDRNFDYQQEIDQRDFDYQREQDARDFDYKRYLNDLDMGYQMDSDAYKRGQSAQADAQKRISSFLSIGGDVSQLDPSLIALSGYSRAEMDQMQRYYAQQAVPASGLRVGSSSGGSTGGGNNEYQTTGNSQPIDYNAYLRGYDNGSPVTQDTINQMLVPETAQLDNQRVQSLMALYPNGEINENDWATVADVFGENWLNSHGFKKRSFYGEYRAETQSPSGSLDIPAQIEKAKSSYGGAKTFLRNYNADSEVIDRLMTQSETGMDDKQYANYLSSFIDEFLNSQNTPNYNDVLTDLIDRYPAATGGSSMYVYR